MIFNMGQDLSTSKYYPRISLEYTFELKTFQILVESEQILIIFSFIEKNHPWIRKLYAKQMIGNVKPDYVRVFSSYDC